jgi:hypothetical protein
LLENKKDARAAASRNRRRGAETRLAIGQTSGRQYAEVESPVNCSRQERGASSIQEATADEREGVSEHPLAGDAA